MVDRFAANVGPIAMPEEVEVRSRVERAKINILIHELVDSAYACSTQQKLQHRETAIALLLTKDTTGRIECFNCCGEPRHPAVGIVSNSVPDNDDMIFSGGDGSSRSDL